ncbi:hypothetical protein ASF06_04190 [Agreia sp. Leaf244]|nr:hypothetical protein ASF06_04190 [Agreia sp. Leaf244]
MNKFTKATLGLATAGILAVSMAACSTTSETTESTSSSPSSSAESTPTPVASIPELTGVDTAVLLDADPRSRGDRAARGDAPAP